VLRPGRLLGVFGYRGLQCERMQRTAHVAPKRVVDYLVLLHAPSCL
jgi:hypothetical protein